LDGRRKKSKNKRAAEDTGAALLKSIIGKFKSGYSGNFWKKGRFF
jgi:hypothetical protein